ncbi:MAG: 5,6-dimethylbenzimidazole synthase [Magnetococcales bacterium]|nr:5,6-dimethylbenzimidazole synthase [Magnetococcales bacterium]
MGQKKFKKTDRKVLHRIIRARRDMRHFKPNSSVDISALQRILEAGHAAPSVALTQPWRFVRVMDRGLRQSLADEVRRERRLTSYEMGTRREQFLRLKVEGILECAELIAVVMPPDDENPFGRRTMPEEMRIASCACAIQNMWLAARVENLGMGWVSFFDPEVVRELLQAPEGSKPLALLCLGPVKAFYPEPMLALEEWTLGTSLSDLIGLDRYPAEEALPAWAEQVLAESDEEDFEAEDERPETEVEAPEEAVSEEDLPEEIEAADAAPQVEEVISVEDFPEESDDAPQAEEDVPETPVPEEQDEVPPGEETSVEAYLQEVPSAPEPFDVAEIPQLAPPVALALVEEAPAEEVPAAEVPPPTPELPPRALSESPTEPEEGA